MNDAVDPRSPEVANQSGWSDPSVRAYGVAEVLALLAIAFLLFRGMPLIEPTVVCMIPLIGIATLAARAAWGPIAVIVATAFLSAFGFTTSSGALFGGLALLAALAHYRALRLLERIAPKRRRTAGRFRALRERFRLRALRDSFRLTRSRTADAVPRRDEEGPPPPRLPSRELTGSELALLSLTLFLWPVAAVALWRLSPPATQTTWSWFADSAIWPHLPSPGTRRTLALLWTLGGMVVVTRIIHGVARWGWMTPLQAETYLNDVVWREHRREVDHISRRLGRYDRRRGK